MKRLTKQQTKEARAIAARYIDQARHDHRNRHASAYLIISDARNHAFRMAGRVLATQIYNDDLRRARIYAAAGTLLEERADRTQLMRRFETTGAAVRIESNP